MAECSESAVSSAVMEDGRKLGYEHLRHRMLMVSLSAGKMELLPLTL